MKQIFRNRFILGAVLLACSPLFLTTLDGAGANVAPLDGGVSLLAISGVAYGLNKYRAQRKKSNANADETEATDTTI